MAATAPSSDHLPLLHSAADHPTTDPPAFTTTNLPPDYYAPSQPIPTTTNTRPPLHNPHSSRSVRFQSPPADPPRSAPDNHSLLPPYTPRSTKPPKQSTSASTSTSVYRGHSSEAEYLAALREWAEDKAMMQPGNKSQLPGFYGRETMEECIAKNPKLRDRPSRRERERKKEQEAVEEGEGEGDGAQRGEVRTRRRKSSFGQWLSRKRTN